MISEDEWELAERSRRVKLEAQRLGFELVGVSPVQVPPHQESFADWMRKKYHGELNYMERTASLRSDPARLVPWAVSVISVGMNYHKPPSRPSQPERGRGWISRYAWGDDYHLIIDTRLHKLLEIVRTIFDASMEGRVFVDSGPVLERDFAGIAGIGWIGKNTQLISPQRGSWFFLGELFVSLPLAYDKAIRDRCGQCDLCLKACPTGAFAGPFVLDARRCISYLTIELKGSIPRHLRPLIGNHIFGCDICQEVCPYNVKAEPSKEPGYEPRRGLYAPELIPLLSMNNEEFRRRFRASPILRAKRRGFLRNVAVALGNSAAPEAVPALVRALDDEEPLIRGHVAWALGRIATADAIAALRQKLSVESDPEVISEIEEAVSDGLARRPDKLAGSRTETPQAQKEKPAFKH